MPTQVFCFAFTLNSFGKSEQVAKAAMNCTTSLINSGALDPHAIAPLLAPFVSADDSSLVTKAVDTLRLLEQKTHFTQNTIELSSRVSHHDENLADDWFCEVVNIAKSDRTCQQRLATLLSSLLKPVERNECDDVGILSSLHSLPASKMLRFVELSLRITVSTIREMHHLAHPLSVSRDIVWRCHALLVGLRMTGLTIVHQRFQL
ncbi:hypothetical protein BLNAU_20518 [Blattamonas nauphoetae]|uniref:Uncharacterized protein n=1 Tax=Blattamonas nauphoetae TaxID=2049346 RepID=A0ABQ9WYG6_9EUKA|nr:hypothetical protein BLNAU_20518 [Blattamonas nauphoetae]